MRFAIILPSLFIVSSLLKAQQSILFANDEQQVRFVILELFDDYRAGDSLRIRNTFTTNATFQSAYYNKEEQSILSKLESISTFANYIGGGLYKEHDERLWNTSIQIDKNFASAWTNYVFYLNGQFSHCGSENFLLIKFIEVRI